MFTLTCQTCHTTVFIGGERDVNGSGTQDHFLSGAIPSLSTRALNALAQSGVRTVGQLCSLSQRDLRRLRNVGTLTIDEIRQKLTALGRHLVGEDNISVTSLTESKEVK